MTEIYKIPLPTTRLTPQGNGLHANLFDKEVVEILELKDFQETLDNCLTLVPFSLLQKHAWFVTFFLILCIVVCVSIFSLGV